MRYLPRGQIARILLKQKIDPTPHDGEALDLEHREDEDIALDIAAAGKGSINNEQRDDFIRACYFTLYFRYEPAVRAVITESIYDKNDYATIDNMVANYLAYEFGHQLEKYKYDEKNHARLGTYLSYSLQEQIRKAIYFSNKTQLLDPQKTELVIGLLLEQGCHQDSEVDCLNQFMIFVDTLRSDRFSSRERDIFLSRDLQGISVEQAATKFGMKHDAVKQAHRRIRIKLYAALLRTEIGEDIRSYRAKSKVVNKQLDRAKQIVSQN